MDALFDRRIPSVLVLGAVAIGVACGPTQGSPDGSDESGSAAEHDDGDHATAGHGEDSSSGSGSAAGDAEAGGHSPAEQLCEDCWYEAARTGVCVAEWDACAASLACEQLRQ